MQALLYLANGNIYIQEEFMNSYILCLLSSQLTPWCMTLSGYSLLVNSFNDRQKICEPFKK